MAKVSALQKCGAFSLLQGYSWYMTNIFLKTKSNTYEKLNLSDIVYIKGCGDYTEVYIKGKRFVQPISMIDWEEILSSNSCNGYRCHKSFIVNLDKVDKVEDWTLFLGEERINVGDVYRKDLLAKLNYIGGRNEK